MSRKTFETTCILDCPDTCALEVTVDQGKLSELRGSPDGLTGGFICSKVSRFERRLYHRDRILGPMRRSGRKGEGSFEPISWGEALGEIVERFGRITEEWGGEAILPYHYGGSNGFLGDDSIDDFFFARLGASRLEKTLCAAPTTAVARGMYGKMPGVAFQDYPKARFILIWGANPKASNIHLIPELKKARKNGAFLAVVDPQNHFSDNEIDLHLPVRPGADLPLALSLIRIWREQDRLDQDFLDRHATGVATLLEACEPWTARKAAAETGIEESAIKRLAERFAETSPALLRCGWGLERNANGGQAVAAVLALPALLGNFGVRGGGYTLSNTGATLFDTRRAFGDFDWQTRILNMSKLGKILEGPLDPPVKSLFVYNCNPVVTAPDQNKVLSGLQRADLFTVVHEQVMTDTARFADLLLPATTFLEQREIRRSYGDYKVGGIQPVIQPLGETWPNYRLFAELGRSFGWNDEPFHWDEDTLFNKIVDSLRMDGGSPDRTTLAKGGSVRNDFGRGAPVQFRDVFPRTPDRKINLRPDILGPEPYRYLGRRRSEFPLALISPATSKMVSSMFGEFNYPSLALTLHPEDAASRGICTGDSVRVFNELGEVRCTAKVHGRVRQGVAVLPKGAWNKSSLNGRVSTALCPDTVNRVAGGACFNDARVEVERAEESGAAA